MFATSKLLEQNGHVVIPFAMDHPLNFESRYSKYWPSYIDYKTANKVKSIRNVIRVITRTVYSLESKRKMAKLLEDHRPDLVHVHNLHHHITPSILGEIKKRKIPIVWTLHDYTILCPNTSFLTENGDVCEACKKNKYFMAPMKKCKKNSLAASSVAMLENYVHRLMRVYRHVDKFIAPSNYLANKFIEYGMGEQIIKLNNFVDTDKYEPNYLSGDYYVYIGRLNQIKGIDILLQAACKNPDIKLKVVGDGDLIDEYKTNKSDNVEFIGFKSGDELRDIVSNAMFAVVPSQWYENSPYSVLEPMALGKPVIGSCIGGIPELVEDGRNGFLFSHKDVNQLSIMINRLARNRELQVQMGKQSRRIIEEMYSQKKHYEQLMEIYNMVLND